MLYETGYDFKTNVYVNVFVQAVYAYLNHTTRDSVIVKKLQQNGRMFTSYVSRTSAVVVNSSKSGRF